MIYDFNLAECPAPSHADICLIGAGAAGILLATQLAAAGLRVTLLEGGGRLLETESQDLYRSQLAGLHHNGIHTGRFRTFGGTTTEWGGQILELDEEDFVARDWVPGSGWPFPKSTLTRAYDRALEFAGLRRVTRDDQAVWKELGLQPPDLSPEFYMAFSRWCPERNFAKLHDAALAGSKKLSVFCHANAIRFTLNQDQTAIASVVIQNFNNRTCTVTADQFVVCMGGIESTRFLLQPAEQGLLPWQANGILGRYYQDHIGLNGIEIRDLQTQPAHKYFGYVFSRGFRYHNKIRLRFAEQKTHHTLNVVGTLGPPAQANEARGLAFQTLRQIRNGNREIPPVDLIRAAIYLPFIAGEMLARRLGKEPPPWKQTCLAVHCEQSPLSSSTITLSADRDKLGMLRTRLDWKISAEEIYTLRTYVKIAEAEFRKHNFGNLIIPPGFYDDDSVVLALCGDSYHHMGSTRMSFNPQDGVVDPDLRLHGISNGYICSSSVFPCSGFSNPTHTMLALAMRLSDHLIEKQTGRAITPADSSTPPPLKISSVTLPGNRDRQTSQLGFGCAYLLGAGLDAIASRRLLDAAWDAGIRHFDAAHLYGQGQTEALLGQFLKDHPEATITTKYGLNPPSTPRRIALALQRRIPGMNGKLVNPSHRNAGSFDAADARASLDRSLRLLQRDYIDLFLLHEPEVSDLAHNDLLEFLESAKTAGKIGDFGIGGEYHRIPALYAERKSYCRVLQFEWSILGPALDVPDAFRIHYRLFAPAARLLAQKFQQDPALERSCSDAANADLAEPAVLSRLLLKAALDAYPESPALFSTRNESHIFSNAAVATDTSLSTPAARLVAELRRNSMLP